MLSHFSLDAMALSGADFDGDLVKIIADQTIVSAIKAGTYQESQIEKSSRDKKTYKRKLPIIMIPDTKSAAKEIEDKGTIPYSTIKNTFDNSIGLISNMAVQLQRMENVGIEFIKDGEKYENISTPACTVVTGLEIDAAKTSVHPISNIKEIREAIGEDYGDYFLKAKESISQMPTHGIALEKTRDGYVFKSAKKEYLKIKAKPGAEVDQPSILDHLPSYFADKKLELKEVAKQKVPASKNVHFNFELMNPSWNKELDSAKKKELSSLMKAYCGILSFASRLYDTREMYRDAKYKGCVVHLLKVQYDNLDMPLSGEVSILDALDHTYLALNELFSSNQASPDKIADNVAEVLSNMVNSSDVDGVKWQNTPMSKRRARLNALLGYKDSEPNIPTEAYLLLTNFDCYGYKLLYYILKDIIAVNRSNISADAVKATLDGDDPENDESVTKKSSGAIDWKALNNNQFFKEFYDIYSAAAAQNTAKKIWQSRIIHRCKYHLSAMFDGDMSIALRYVFDQKGSDKNRWFFWDVLPEDVILSQVWFAQEKGDQNNAE